MSKCPDNCSKIVGHIFMAMSTKCAEMLQDEGMGLHPALCLGAHLRYTGINYLPNLWVAKPRLCLALELGLWHLHGHGHTMHVRPDSLACRPMWQQCHVSCEKGSLISQVPAP